MFIKSIETIRTGPTFANTYSWDIKFEGADLGPFADWFPANSITEPIGNIEPFTWQYGSESFQTIKSKGNNILSATFYDSDDLVLETWLEKWLLECFPKSGCVAPIESVARTVSVARVNVKKEVIKLSRYTVILINSIANQLNSESELKLMTVDFGIVGKV